MNPFDMIVRLYSGFFGAVEYLARGWFLGFAARFVFFAVLYFYYFNSWKTKVGEGLFGVFDITPGAYYQIAPWAMEAAGGDISGIGLFGHLVVITGTWAELLLPNLIVVGLFARAAALGMIIFIIVQSYVDIAFHGVGPETIGAWFDRFSDSLIMDQRTFWVFTLLVIVTKGPGMISADYLLTRARAEADQRG